MKDDLPNNQIVKPTILERTMYLIRIRKLFLLVCLTSIALILVIISYLQKHDDNSSAHVVNFDHYARGVWSLSFEISMMAEQYKNRFGEYPNSIEEAELALRKQIIRQNPFYSIITDKEKVIIKCHTDKIGMSIGAFYFSPFPPQIWRQYQVIRTKSLPDDQEKLLMRNSYDVQDKASPGNYAYFPVFNSQKRCVGYFIAMYDIPGGPMLYPGRGVGKGKSGVFRLVPQDLYYWTGTIPSKSRPEIDLYWADETQREITLNQVWNFAYEFDIMIAEKH